MSCKQPSSNVLVLLRSSLLSNNKNPKDFEERNANDY